MPIIKEKHYAGSFENHTCETHRCIDFEIRGERYVVEVPRCTYYFIYRNAPVAEAAATMMNLYPNVYVCSQQQWPVIRSSLWPKIKGPHSIAARDRLERYFKHPVYARRACNCVYIDVHATIESVGEPITQCKNCGTDAIANPYCEWIKADSEGAWACSDECLTKVATPCVVCGNGIKIGQFNINVCDYQCYWKYCQSESDRKKTERDLCRAEDFRRLKKIERSQRDKERFLIAQMQTTQALEKAACLQPSPLRKVVAKSFRMSRPTTSFLG